MSITTQSAFFYCPPLVAHRDKGFFMEIEYKGRKLLLDKEDLDLFNSVSWYFKDTGKRHTEYLYNSGIQFHRLLMGVTDRTIQVDHINGNGIDNRKCNLRLVSHAENLRSQQVREYTATGKKKTSRFKGVSISENRIRACITINGHCIKLGSFKDEALAASAYNEAAIKHFGEFAVLNII